MPPLNLNSFSSFFSPSHHHSTRPFLGILVSSFSSLSKTPNPLVFDFLINTLDFSETHALTIANRYSRLKSLERPRAVVQYFQTLGLSDKQIQSSVRGSPQILTSDVDKTIKPKIEYFQQLGLSDSHLGKFVSKTSSILTLRFERKLVPCVELLKRILVNDKNNEDLLKVLRKCCWLVCVDTDSVLLPNVRFLESCGIVGTQLAMLLRGAPRLFTMPQATLRSIVSRVSDMGFDMKSRMFVYAFFGIGSCSVETFERKVETYVKYGFSRDEYMEMARKAPYLLKVSVEKSIIGLDFYINTVKLEKEVLIRRPTYLLYSMENRVIPRYRVLEVVKSKQLLKKKTSYLNVFNLTEEVFQETYISKFTDHAEELLVAYKGHILDYSSEEEMSKS